MNFKILWNLLNIYDLMIIAMLVLSAYNLQKFSLSYAVPIISIIISAGAIDFIIIYVKEKRKPDGRAGRVFRSLPRSALISGLILSLILQGPLLFLILVSAIAILSKHVIKIKNKHIFNPAIFGLFVALFLPVSQSWWGTSNLLLVALLGIVIVYKLKRFHLALPFLAVHAAVMFVLFSFDVNQLVAHIISGSLLFFAFYMMIEPITSPLKMKSSIIFGILAGVFASILYALWLPAMLVGALFFAGLCVPILNWKPRV